MTALFDVGVGGTACPSCGTVTMREARTIGGRRVMCWPGGDDGATCASCWQAGVAKRERIRREVAQAEALVPPLYRGVSWRERDQRVVQATGEDDKPFVARVREGRETDARVFGISIADRPSLRAIAGWRPEHGSMFIEGAPGTGKSIAAAALANDLVTVPMSYRCVCRDCEDRWRSATDATMDDPWEGWDQERHDRTRGAARLRVTGPSSVRYQQEGGIIAALRKPKEEGQGQVKAGVLDVCKAVEVLFLDDLGSKEALADWHKDVLFELIDWRYTQVRPRRPVVFTSNMPMSDLSLRYGERFASRVREMVGDRRYQLTTMWR